MDCQASFAFLSSSVSSTIDVTSDCMTKSDVNWYINNNINKVKCDLIAHIDFNQIYPLVLRRSDESKSIQRRLSQKLTVHCSDPLHMKLRDHGFEFRINFL